MRCTPYGTFIPSILRKTRYVRGKSQNLADSCPPSSVVRLRRGYWWRLSLLAIPVIMHIGVRRPCSAVTSASQSGVTTTSKFSASSRLCRPLLHVPGHAAPDDKCFLAGAHSVSSACQPHGCQRMGVANCRVGLSCRFARKGKGQLGHISRAPAQESRSPRPPRGQTAFPTRQYPGPPAP